MNGAHSIDVTKNTMRLLCDCFPQSSLFRFVERYYYESNPSKHWKNTGGSRIDNDDMINLLMEWNESLKIPGSHSHTLTNPPILSSRYALHKNDGTGEETWKYSPGLFYDDQTDLKIDTNGYWLDEWHGKIFADSSGNLDMRDITDTIFENETMFVERNNRLLTEKLSSSSENYWIEEIPPFMVSLPSSHMVNVFEIKNVV